jgi:Flp pilus assembly protein TadG
VEFAFVLPVFLMLLVGIVEFGRWMTVGQLVAHAAREGARTGVVNYRSNADVEQTVAAILQETLNLSSGSITTTVTVEPAPGNPNASNQVANAAARDLVIVNVRVPFDDVSLIPSQYLGGKFVTGEARMRHE